MLIRRDKKVKNVDVEENRAQKRWKRGIKKNADAVGWNNKGKNDKDERKT